MIYWLLTAPELFPDLPDVSILKQITTKSDSQDDSSNDHSNAILDILRLTKH